MIELGDQRFPLVLLRLAVRDVAQDPDYALDGAAVVANEDRRAVHPEDLAGIGPDDAVSDVVTLFAIETVGDEVAQHGPIVGVHKVERRLPAARRHFTRR
jgi:hypothetical protein